MFIFCPGPELPPPNPGSRKLTRRRIPFTVVNDFRASNDRMRADNPGYRPTFYKWAEADLWQRQWTPYPGKGPFRRVRPGVEA